MTATDVLSHRPARLGAGRPTIAQTVAAGAVAAARLPRPVLIYLFCAVLPLFFNAGPLLMSTLRLQLLIMVVPLLFRLLTGRLGPLIVTDFLFIAHILWAVAALAYNNPDQVIQQVGSVGMEFIGGYLIGRAYIRTPEAFGALCKALALIVCLGLPLSLYEAMTGVPVIIQFLRSLPGVYSVSFVWMEPRMGLERVQSSFAHPIHYGLFCSVAFSLTFVALKGFTSTPRRVVTAVLVGGCGFLALSSGALLAVILQIALITWSVALAQVRQRWWILVGLFVLAYIIIDILSNRTPIRVFMSYATFSAHNAYWRGIIFEWGMKNVWGSPIFGIGLNDWVRPHYMYSGSMDNFWLVMAVRYGIPGFLFLALGYAIAVLRIMRRDFEGNEILTNFRRAWVFTFLGLSFTLCTVHIWTNIYSFVFFMFGAGIWFIHAPAGEASEPGGDVAVGGGPRSRLAARTIEPRRTAPAPIRAVPAPIVPGPEPSVPRPPLPRGGEGRSPPANAYSRFPTSRSRGAARPSDAER